MWPNLLWRRTDCTLFTRPIFDYIVAAFFFFLLCVVLSVLSIYTSLCLLSKIPNYGRQIFNRLVEKRPFFVVVFFGRLQCVLLVVLSLLFGWWRGLVTFCCCSGFHFVCSYKPKIELSSRIEWSLDLGRLYFWHEEYVQVIVVIVLTFFVLYFFHLTSNISLPPPLLEHNTRCYSRCCYFCFKFFFIFGVIVYVSFSCITSAEFFCFRLQHDFSC